MTRRSAFPSRIIDLKRLDRESRRLFCLGLVIGSCFILLVFAMIPYRNHASFIPQAEQSQIPITLVTLPPNALNPYETWQYEHRENPSLRPDATPVMPELTPIYKKTAITGEQPVVHASSLAEHMFDTLTVHEDSLITALLPEYPDTLFSRYRDPSISRYEADRFSMNELMLSFDEIDALGHFKAFIIRDPEDKQNIQGYYHIPQFIADYGPPGYDITSALGGLSEAFNYYTGLNMIVDAPQALTASDMQTYPVIYLVNNSVAAVEANSHQTTSLYHYLTHGGFAIIENGLPWSEWTPAKASLLYLIMKTFGDSLEMKPLPRDHLLLHCFFDIDMPAPDGAENWSPPSGDMVLPNWGNLLRDNDLDTLRKRILATNDTIWGIWHDEHLVALYSDKGYGYIWRKGILENKWWDFYSGSNEKYNFNQQLKLGVNMLVYALLHEGGLAKKLTNYAEK